MNKQTLKQSIEIAGKVSKGNTKMPGSTFPLDAFKCNVGGRLAKIKGSTCFKCYAIRLQKLRPNVNQGWASNHAKTISALAKCPEQWESAIIHQISRFGFTEHRWLDSGDIPNIQFIVSVCHVAKRTPSIDHWLPTREIKLLLQFIKQYGADYIPGNLTIRVSAPMVNDKPMRAFDNIPQIVTSTVHDKHTTPIGHICPARTQGNSCGDCRACWSDKVANVSYPIH